MYIGLDQFLEYYDSGTSSYIAFDPVHGGELSHTGGEVRHHDGIGGQDVVTYGVIVPTGRAEFYARTLSILGNAKRASKNALPTAIPNIQGGLEGVTNGALKQTTCYIDVLTVACEVEGLVDCTVQWLALSEDKVTVAEAASTDDSDAFVWYMATLEIDGSSYQAQSFTATLRNNLKGFGTLDAGSDGSRRLPEEIVPGIMEVTLSVDVKLPTGIDLTADTPDTIGFKFTAQTPSGSKTFTLDLTGGNKLHPSSVPIPLVEGANDVIWRIEAEAKHNDLDVWSLSVA